MLTLKLVKVVGIPSIAKRARCYLTIVETGYHTILLKSFFSFEFKSLQPLNHILNNLISLGLPTEIWTDVLPLTQPSINGGINLIRSLRQIHKLQHDSHTPHCSHWIRNPFPLNIWSTSMTRLAHPNIIAHICRRHKPQAAHQRCRS